MKLTYTPIYTVDACDHGAGSFTDNTVPFTAGASQVDLTFDFVTRESSARIKIDNVVVVRA